MNTMGEAMRSRLASGDGVRAGCRLGNVGNVQGREAEADHHY